jgi:hypothetical protein
MVWRAVKLLYLISYSAKRMLSRFVWWWQHDANAPAIFVQALSAGVTAIVTAVLCWLNYRYLVYTQKQAETTLAQLRASMRPIIDIQLRFGGAQDSFGGDKFKDIVAIKIANVGAHPLMLRTVVCAWEHSSDAALVEQEVRPFRGIVVSAEDHAYQEFRLSVNGKPPTVERFDSWSDFFSVTVSCCDIGGISNVTYEYQRVTGLRVLRL